jgi:exoribonuclease-2
MKVVIVEDRDSVRWAVVLEDNREKLKVQDDRGQQVWVPRKKVLFELRPADPGGTDPIGEVRRRVEASAADVDVPLLWSLAREEGRSGWTLEELARLYFGPRPLPEEQAALYLRLASEALYFRRRGDLYEPRRPEQVEALQHQREAEQARQSRIEAMVRRLTRWIHEPTAPWTEEDRQLAEAVLAYFRRKADDRTLHDLQQAFSAVPGLQEDPTVLIPIVQAMGLVQSELEGLLIYYGVEPSFDPEEWRLAEAVPAFVPPETPSRTAPLGERTPAVSQTAPTVDRRPAEGWTFSIDEPETQEIDDALSVHFRPDGTVEVGVHIAEAAYFIRKDTPLDRCAERRVTTVYLPEATLYMLPPPISTDKASLLAGQPRPVLSLLTEWTPEGHLRSWSIEPRWIVVQERLTYRQADDILRDPSHALYPALRFLAEQARRFFDERRARGAFHLVRPEVKVRVQGADEARPSIRMERLDLETPARTLVREWMIAYNARVAEWAAVHDVPMIYRSQDPPAEPLPAEWTSMDTYRPSVFRALIRQFRRSTLWPSPREHWALGLPAYIQASSPLRRYADLVTQRQILACLQNGRPLYSRESLLRMMTVIEEQTALRKELEERRRRYWILRYLAEQPPTAVYTATVVEKKAGGLYIIELDDYLLEGVLSYPGTLDLDAKITVRLLGIDWQRLNYKAQVV